MDDLDRAILAVLDRAGRVSNTALAEQVGLSPSPCLRRVRRLEKAGVILGYRAEIEPTALGRSLRVLVGVRLVRHDRTEVQAFEKAVVQLSEIAFAHHVTGGFDYLLQVEVADLRTFEDFHANRLASLPNVGAVTSYVTMKTLTPTDRQPTPPTFTD